MNFSLPQIAMHCAVAGAFFAAAAGPASGCCAVSRKGQPVVNADQAVILIWDPATRTEHFIRRASFKSDADDVGFLVPTPSRPQLEESGNDAFSYVASITAPRYLEARPGCALGCSVAAPQTAAVRVIEEKSVAGFHAVVLNADSGAALVAWLKDHGYAYSAECEAWAKPYIAGGWYFTAMKIDGRKAEKKDAGIAASALRISFQTDRPLFPYREPDSRKAAAALGVSDRLLRIYLITDSRYAGHLGESSPWSGSAVWSGPLSASQRKTLLTRLNLPADTGPSDFCLTEFEDHWKYGNAAGDLYFSRAKDQSELQRPLQAAVGVDPTFLALGLFGALRPAFRRRRPRR